MGEAVGIRRVVKRYGPVTALHGVSLAISDNEFFTLLGPSGCGKTTLLRLIAGFEELSGGSILLHGQDIAQLPPDKRPVNTVFQSYALFPHMTVADNVAFGLKMKGIAPEARRRRAGEMLELVHLSALADATAGPAFGRPAAARGLGARARARAAGAAAG
jgi:spermidine/putrescine transport system ATP-binding protein